MARDAASELGSIVAPRGLTCKATDAQCTKCPKPTVKKGKCPKGAKCKRELLDARAEVGMDSIGEGSWGPGELIETPGLSYCSVMAVCMQFHTPFRCSGVHFKDPQTMIQEQKKLFRHVALDTLCGVSRDKLLRYSVGILLTLICYSRPEQVGDGTHPTGQDEHPGRLKYAVLSRHL